MYKEYFRTNNSNGNIIVDIALDNYSDYYHPWDNTSRKTRDMHPRLAEFIDICSADIPLNKQIEFQFQMNEERNETKESEIRRSFQNYYKYTYRIGKNEIRRDFSSVLIFASVSVIFLIISLLIARLNATELLQEVLSEGFSIGGWVFMWEAVSIFAFGISKKLKRKREHKRFISSDIYFNNKESIE